MCWMLEAVREALQAEMGLAGLQLSTGAVWLLWALLLFFLLALPLLLLLVAQMAGTWANPRWEPIVLAMASGSSCFRWDPHGGFWARGQDCLGTTRVAGRPGSKRKVSEVVRQGWGLKLLPLHQLL